MGMVLVPQDEHTFFDADDLKRVLATLPTVSDVEEVDDGFVTLEWRITDGNGTASAALQVRGEAINLDPENRAAAQFAFALATRLSFATNLLNEDYTYHLVPASYGSGDELWSQIQVAYERATDGLEPYRG